MNRKILIVEDNQEISSSFLALATTTNSTPQEAIFSFEIAEHVEEAIDKLKSITYSGVILDIILPSHAKQLEEVRALELLRREADMELQRLMETGNGEDSLQSIQLQARIMQYDEASDRHQDVEAARHVIESIAIDGLVPVSPSFVFLTARGDPAFRARLDPFFRGRPYEWIAKPEPSERVLRAMQSLLNGRPNT